MLVRILLIPRNCLKHALGCSLCKLINCHCLIKGLFQDTVRGIYQTPLNSLLLKDADIIFHIGTGTDDLCKRSQPCRSSYFIKITLKLQPLNDSKHVYRISFRIQFLHSLKDESVLWGIEALLIEHLYCLINTVGVDHHSTQYSLFYFNCLRWDVAQFRGCSSNILNLSFPVGSLLFLCHSLTISHKIIVKES